MTVIKGFTHRSIHTNAQGTNKILILISVVHKAMYDLDLLTSGVEVETDYERKPLPSSLTSVRTLPVRSTVADVNVPV